VLLIAGSGLGAAAGGALVANQLQALGRLETKVLQHLGITLLPAPDPHPLPDGPMTTPRDVVIFDGALAAGWHDAAWGTYQAYQLPDTSVSYGGKAVITLHLAQWGGVQLYSDAFETAGFGYVQCWVRGAGGSGQVAYTALVTADGSWGPKVVLGDYTQSGGVSQDEWRLTRVPLDALGALSAQVTAVVVQAGAQQSQGALHLADVRLVYHPRLAPPRVTKVWALDLGTITLAFDEAMVTAEAANPLAYLLASDRDPAYPAAHPVAPLVAHYHPDARTVSLWMPQPLHVGDTYTVTLGPIADQLGVRTTAGTRAQVRVTAQPLAVTVDAAEGRRPISREIYGAANVDPAAAVDLGVTLMRWGGNAVTRYNWKLGNAFNAARDYYFKNGNYGNVSSAARMPSGVADDFVASNTARDITSLLTIPTIGWVARNDDVGSLSVNVPRRGGPPLRANGDAIAGYDPMANRQRTCVPSRARKGTALADPPGLHDPTVAQDEWVYHLVRRFGTAAQGGVRYYAMDNEPDLWWVTHTDIRPAQLSYTQMRDTFLDYATAIKDVDPTAQITGPVSWGWTNYFYSPLDRGDDTYHSHADRAAHADMPLVPWWLAEIRRHDEAAGRRTLDVLDLHYYPQGSEYMGDASATMSTLRLRSTRALWDPTYVDESWIAEPVRLIPRMREWVDLNYPGTKLGLTEWNWGAEHSMNGALALAQVLGIFGREGLDIAAHWGGLDAGTPAYLAFKLYGNYDSAGNSFSGTSFAAHATQPDLLSCYGAQSKDGGLALMVINSSADTDLTPDLRVDQVSRALGGGTPRRMRAWRLWPDEGMAITRGPDVDLPGASSAPLVVRTTFPASSITLVRLEVSG
jgi:hypothetical protein